MQNRTRQYLEHCCNNAMALLDSAMKTDEDHIIVNRDVFVEQMEAFLQLYSEFAKVGGFGNLLPSTSTQH